MAEEIEIKNVMGSRGVASEATLLLLLDEFKKQNGGSSTVTRDRTVELFNRSAADATRSFDNTGDAADGLGKRFMDTAKTFAAGARRTEDFVKALAGGEGYLSSLAGYLDRTVDTFRTLSNVGAGFNNSMFDMIRASADSAMELGDFAQFVNSNAETIRLLGGTVTEGIAAFGEVSKQLRNSDLGYSLMGMGFTIEDLNDGIANYIDLQYRLGRGETVRNQNLSVATAEYLEELDDIAKATGRSREEIANLGKQIAADGRIRSLQARLNGDASDNLTRNLTIAAGAIPGLTESFFNMASGAPIDDFSKLLISSVGPAGQALNDLMLQADDMDPAAFTEEFTRLMPQIGNALRSMDPKQLAALGEFGSGLAARLPDLANMGYMMDKTAMMSLRAAQEEEDRARGLTGIFGNFENAIISARRFLVDTFLDSALAESLRQMGTKLGSLFSENETGGIGWGLNLLERAFNVFAGPQGVLTRVVDWMTRELDEGGALYDAYVWFTNTVAEIGESIGVWWESITQSIETQGLWATIQSEFERLFTGFRGTIDNLFGTGTNPRDALEQQLATAEAQMEEAKAAGDIASMRTLADTISNLKSQIGEIPETKSLFEQFVDRFNDYIFGTTPQQEASRLESALDELKQEETKWENNVNNVTTRLAREQRELERLQQRPNALPEQLEAQQNVVDFYTRALGNANNKLSEVASEIDSIEGQLASPETIQGTGGIVGAISSGLERAMALVDASGVVDTVKNWFNDFLFGEVVANTRFDDTGAEIREGGLIETITQGFSDLLDRPSILETITNGFTRLLNAAEDAIQRVMGLPTEGSLWEQILNRVGLSAAEGQPPLYEQILQKVGLTSTGNETILEQIGNKIYDKMFGEVVGNTRPDGMGEEIRQGGLIESLSNALMEIFRHPSIQSAVTTSVSALFNTLAASQEVMDSISNAFISLINVMEEAFVNSFLVRNLLGIDRREVASRQAERTGQVSAEEAQNFAASIAQMLDETLTVGLGALGLNFDLGGKELRNTIAGLGESQQALIDRFAPSASESALLSYTENDQMQIAFERMSRAAEEGNLTANEMNTLREIFKALNENSHANGTIGFKDFGTGTPAMLHGREAVVPFDSPEGRLLRGVQDGVANSISPRNGMEMLANDIRSLISTISLQANTQPQPIPVPSTDQTALINKLDELNTTMKEVYEILDEGNSIQDKTRRSLQRGGGDFMRGIPG